MKPVFSVIIAAQDRTKYIVEAINSVRTQSIDPKFYEIIMVTNFPFDIEDVNIKRFTCTEEGAGAKLAVGIENAEGKIIAPLDDDDLWESHRLERIHALMSKDQSIVYYHNRSLKIDESGKLIPDRSIREDTNSVVKFTGDSSFRIIRKMQSMRVDWNSSSIVFKKDILAENLELLKSIERSPESLFFYSSLLPDATIAVDFASLTEYRIHAKNTSTLKTVITLDKNIIAENFRHHLNDGKLIEKKANEECESVAPKLKAAMRNNLDDMMHLHLLEDSKDPKTIGRYMGMYLRIVMPALSFYDIVLLTLGFISLINHAIARAIYLSKFRL